MAGKGSVFDNGGYSGVKVGTTGILSTTLTYDGKAGPISNGLVIYLDAGNSASYPGTGTTWYDLSGNANNFTVQAAAYATVNGIPHMNFEGSYGLATRSSGSDVPYYANSTVMVFTSIKNSTADWRTLLRGTSADHQVIISTGNLLGMYDNNADVFLSSGFNITSLPNPYTQFNCLAFRLSSSPPYYQFSYNGGTSVAAITDSRAATNNGFYALGAYQGPSQYWGKIAVFLYYNRELSPDEISQNYSFFRARFGV